MSRHAARVTDTKKVNAELFTLTYGALVQQLIKDYENADEVNKNLDRIGYHIGIRLIEDFLARTNFPRCVDLRDTADKILQSFKLYLNLSPNLNFINSEEFAFVFDSTPFGEFVELPDGLHNLKYANILPGVVRGACEMVQMEVLCWVEKDTLKGDNATELRVRFVKKLEDAMPAGED